MTKAVSDNSLEADAGRPAGIHRRALLTGAGVVATALSGAAMVTPAVAFNATPAENAPRYQASEHVKTFYRVASR